MDIHNEFIAQEKNLVFYAGKPIINKRHAFYDVTGEGFNFPEDTGEYRWNVWEEREGGIQLIAWSSPQNLSRSGHELILNSSAELTDIEKGKYYYEIEYIITGGYPVLLAYGQAKFI